MRLEKYTLECRVFGQAEGAHKHGASERHSQNPLKSLDFNGKRSVYGVPENACIFGEITLSQPSLMPLPEAYTAYSKRPLP